MTAPGRVVDLPFGAISLGTVATLSIALVLGSCGRAGYAVERGDTGPASLDAFVDPAIDSGVEIPRPDASTDGGGLAVDAAADAAAGEDAGRCRFDEGSAGTGICPMACTGGCIDGLCRIDCTGIDECSGRSLTCPPEWPCHVDCDGIDTCNAASIDASSARSLSVSCDGIDSCLGLSATCPPTGDCLLDCRDGDSCDGTTLLCGAGSCVADCDERGEVSLTGCGGAACCDDTDC